jgi:apoptosis-inducing factor 3
MGGEQKELTGPDLSEGIAAGDLVDGAMLLGHAAGEPVLLARHHDDVFAIGASCTHYSGPLAEGLLVGDTVRCPWHHACFSLRTGEAVRAPALNPVATYKVDRRDFRIRVGEKIPGPADGATAIRSPAGAGLPGTIAIVGAGGAGNAAAEMLRREGYAGAITLIGGEDTVPVDRPNLSKDYLAGNAPEEWIPLRPREFYEEHRITLVTGHRVTGIVPRDDGRPGGRLTLDDGSGHEFDRLLLATGAEPVRLSIPGADLAHVHYLRTLADSRSLIEKTKTAKRAVVIGASFIGLEVAASLRTRGLDVAVVAPESRPLERILGPEVGDFVKSLHEEHGVVFRLGRKPTTIDAQAVTLDDGTTVPADFVAVGVGVQPRTVLAEQLGARLDRGVLVNEFLETSRAGVFAAGDIARYPDPRAGAPVRVEHWVVAERQGQAAARCMLGQRRPYADIPFFWSAHYDVTIRYAGHAEQWDEVRIDGSLAARDCAVRYVKGGRTLAVATINRDRESLAAELAMEREVSTR